VPFAARFVVVNTQREERVMNARYKIALAIVAGAGIGAAAIEGLHAQAKPPTYVVVAVRSIKDADGFKAGVVDKATPASVAAFGGRYLVRGQPITSFDGKPPDRLVLLAFDSPEKAVAWHDSPTVKEINAAREKTTDSLSFMVEGLAN
jgi:uncharacterized protein (DUF1330 family)